MKGCPSAPRFASPRASESRLGLDSRRDLLAAELANLRRLDSCEAALLRRLDECEAVSRLDSPLGHNKDSLLSYRLREEYKKKIR